jgi:hypothetical protein
MSTFLLNPYTYVVATPSGITRIFYDSSYTASRSTRAATAAINVSTIGSVNSGSKGLAVFYMATTDLDVTNADVNFDLINGTTTVIGLNMEPQDTTDFLSMGGGYFDLSETNGSFTASFSQEAVNNAGYAGYSLVGLQLTGSDSGSHSAGATTFRDATYATKTSAPLPAGDYIVVGSAAVLTQDAGAIARVRMFDGTNQFGEMFDIYEQDMTNWTPYWHVFRRTTTGTTTFSLQARSDGSNDMEVRQASVIVLDTSQFSNVYYAESTGSFVTDSSTYVNAMSASFTIANPSNKHLLLAAAMLSGSRAGVSSFNCKLRNTTEGVDYIPEQVREPNIVDELYPTIVCRTVTFSGASNTIAWQLLEELNASGSLRNMTMAILDLGTT